MHSKIQSHQTFMTIKMHRHERCIYIYIYNDTMYATTKILKKIEQSIVDHKVLVLVVSEANHKIYIIMMENAIIMNLFI